MAISDTSVEVLLVRLQALSRAESDPSEAGMRFRIPSEFGEGALAISRDVVDAMKSLTQALGQDFRFEYMDDAMATLREFVARAWFERGIDQVSRYIAQHRRELLEVICFVPVEYLKVEEPTEFAGFTFLPPTDSRIPSREDPWFDLNPPVGSVVPVAVSGTDTGKMAERAVEHVAALLRIARIGLRDHPGLNDYQLRFRVGTTFALDGIGAGWRSRSDRAYPLTLQTQALESMQRRPVWNLPLTPNTDIEKKAHIAVRWMERARISGEPLISLLYLFFALEALLGDRSEGLKADGIAFRQLVLSHAVTGGFRHPNDTWFLYDQVRSTTVHGGEPPNIDDDTLGRFESGVRDTLNQVLAFAEERNITKRGKLNLALMRHPDVPDLVAWIREHAGADWNTYLEKVLPPALS